MQLSLLLFLAIGVGEDATANWPDFRGGSRSGVVEDKSLPAKWSAKENVLWKVDVPGRGWSSPVVWGERIFLTSVIREGKSEEPTKGLYFGGNRGAPSDLHRWMVYCLDWNSGKVVWEREVHRGVPQTSIHLKNTYASETPVVDGERLYAYFGNLGLFGFDHAGMAVWSRRWPGNPTAFGWGTASSPIRYKGRLYVVNDNEKESFLAAIDCKTGNEVWRVARDEKSNWATPFIWENELRTELVTCGRNRVRSYDLEGKPLWELGGMSSIVIPTPMTKFGLLYISSGYVADKVQPIFAVRPGASGDISLKPGQTSNDHIAWSHQKAGPYNPSPIVYGDYFYVLLDRGFLSCYDAKSGKEIYNRTRIGPGATAFTASPWASSGKIFLLSEDGDTFVVEAGPEYKLLGKNSLDEMCMATPAIAHGNLIIRTIDKVYRIGAPYRSVSR